MHRFKCKFHGKPLCWACIATLDPAFPITHFMWEHLLIPLLGGVL